MYLPLGLVVSDEDFLILDDGEADFIKERTQLEKPTSKVTKNKQSSENNSLSNLISRIQGLIGFVVDKVRSIITGSRKIIAKPERSNDELVLDDGSLENVEPIAGEHLDSKSIMEAELVVDGAEEFEWQLLGMDCPDCAMKATRATKRLPGVNKVVVSATEGTVRVEIDLARGRVSRVSSVLESLGHAPDVDWFTVQGKTAGEVSNRLGIDRKGLRNALLDIPGILNATLDDGRIEIQRISTDSTKVSEMTQEGLGRLLGEYTLIESKTKRLRPDQVQLIGAISTIPLFLLVFAIELLELHWWVAASVTGLGVLFAGMPMFQSAIASIQNRVLGFQVLTSLAVLGALYLKEWPEALVVTGLVALAGHLEESALVRAREAMQGGLDRLPRRARLVDEGQNIDNPGDDEWTPVAALEPGDIVEIRSGEVVPVDGTIVDGSGAIDKAPLTGEPIPVSINKGSFVEAGLTITRGPVHVKAEATGQDTRLADLIDLVRKYREKPTRTQTIIEKFTAIWVPLVLVGSAIYGILTNDIVGMLVLWVVSCPCSLLLAAPVPHATALSSASASGLVARGGEVIEAAAGIELALLDKTGTLTSGRPRLVTITVSGDENEESVLRIAAGLEQRSNHPYATTLIEAAAERSKAITKISGIEDGEAGVKGSMRGLPVMLGRADWLMSEGIRIPYEIDSALSDSRQSGYGASVLSIDGEAVAAFTFAHDDAREGVSEMIQKLQNQGISVEILSGDEQASVEAFAKSLGIDPKICRGNVDPEGKASWVEERAKINRTLMAGDGFNDSGALAAADIGVAVGSGEQVNLDAADILIPAKDPRALANLIHLSKRTRAVVNANIALSVSITILLIITTLAGLNTSIAAGIAIHEASVFIVILNGMFVTGSKGNRIGVLVDIAKDLIHDIREAFGVLFSRSKGSPPSTA